MLEEMVQEPYIFRGRAFKIEQTSSTRALRQKCVWNAGRAARTMVGSRRRGRVVRDEVR